MQHLKASVCFILIVLLTACYPLSESKQTVGLVDNQSTLLGITERAAFELLLMALKQTKVAGLDCLQFRSETYDDTIATTWEFAAIEIHDEICGGDPYVGHVRNRYKVNANGSIMIYDPREGEYEPFKDLQ
ncbi:hypothetical protein [Psychrobacter sp. DAB_AL32B]|uniref:hypothetical protein n=1 Tax=Psychrobacter sp. DAB_AL32B TaxID=1028414 RepID=UPI000B7EA1A5|nr:hypothetical protein [Psychrobacter sp. DAB_AL32B]OXL23756.1 hypothetical protein CAN34_06575 [Psychrobacter sp. DAB_AL32B]